MTSRRDFLTTLGVLAGSVACSRNGASLSQGAIETSRVAERRVERIGIQLYTVRREMQQDLPGTLARLAEMGYDEVEFAGYFGRTPVQIRAVLEQVGLAAPSTHVGYNLLAAEWDRALDDAAAMGHQYVTVPWLPAEPRRTLDGWRRVADEFNRAGERATARGLTFAYHNHDFEFTRVGEGGVVPFDLLLDRTDPSYVQFQLDVFWLVKAGGDPLAYLRAHPSRFTTLHIKDSAGAPEHAQVDVGDGVIDFAAILRLDRAQQRAVKHLFIEHDQPADAMAFAKKSHDYVYRMEI
ncbi:MAG: sugar phosphate isomerase/epimerase [Gemmatimonadaceae bacterium]